jgi:hypothetical protein
VSQRRGGPYHLVRLLDLDGDGEDLDVLTNEESKGGREFGVVS